MNAETSPTRPEWLALGGALAVVVGTWLPWVMVAPWVDAVIQIVVPDTRPGIDGRDYAILGILALGIAAAAHYRQDRRGGDAAAATGGLIVVVAVGSLLAIFVGGPVALGAFVPGPGAVLTVLGGLLLGDAGRRHRAALPRELDEVDRVESPG